MSLASQLCSKERYALHYHRLSLIERSKLSSQSSIVWSSLLSYSATLAAYPTIRSLNSGSKRRKIPRHEVSNQCVLIHNGRRTTFVSGVFLLGSSDSDRSVQRLQSVPRSPALRLDDVGYQSGSRIKPFQSNDPIAITTNPVSCSLLFPSCSRLLLPRSRGYHPFTHQGGQGCCSVGSIAKGQWAPQTGTVKVRRAVREQGTRVPRALYRGSLDYLRAL